MMTMKKMFAKMVSFLTSAVMAAGSLVAVNSFATNALPENQLKSMANEIGILVNEARIENGLEPLKVVPYLCEAAEIRAAESAELFSHTRPGGGSFSTAIDPTVINYTVIAENLAAGCDTAEDTFNQWKASPGHWKNILKPAMTHMGIAVVHDPNGEYEWYWTQIFVKSSTTYADEYLPTEFEIVPKAEGDLNGDGHVDSFDYLILTEYLQKKHANEPVYLNAAQLESADCFSDGIISEADAKAMLRYILGEYKSLPYKF